MKMAFVKLAPSSFAPFSQAQFDTVTHIDQEAWTQELALHQTLFQQLAHHLPPALEATRARIGERLAAT